MKIFSAAFAACAVVTLWWGWGCGSDDCADTATCPVASGGGGAGATGGDDPAGGAGGMPTTGGGGMGGSGGMVPAIPPTISAGMSHTLAIAGDDSLWGWGYNEAFQLGNGMANNISVPDQIAAAPWIAIAAGDYHSCAIDGDNNLWCWGQNDRGQLGDGTTMNRNVPTQVVSGGNTWIKVEGTMHTCGLRNDNTMWCWGDNGNGQLGNGVFSLMPTPTPVQVSPGQTWLDIGVGGNHTCAVRSDQTLWCWGGNSGGQLGQGDTMQELSPVQVLVGTNNWVEVYGGRSGHTCAKRADSTIWCWGANQAGQVGDSSFMPRLLPAELPGGNTWLMVTLGTNHTCGIKVGDTLWCWGSADQLGNGSANDVNTPVQIGAFMWRSVDAGGLFTCGVVGAQIKCWGDNWAGQLGNGTEEDSTSMVDVLPFN